MNCLLLLTLLNGAPTLVNMSLVTTIEKGNNNSALITLTSGNTKVRESLELIQKKQKDECSTK